MANTDLLDALEKRVHKLEDIADEVERLGKKLLQKAPIESYINYNNFESHRLSMR